MSFRIYKHFAKPRFTRFVLPKGSNAIGFSMRFVWNWEQCYTPSNPEQINKIFGVATTLRPNEDNCLIGWSVREDGMIRLWAYRNTSTTDWKAEALTDWIRWESKNEEWRFKIHWDNMGFYVTLHMSGNPMADKFVAFEALSDTGVKPDKMRLVYPYFGGKAPVPTHQFQRTGGDTHPMYLCMHILNYESFNG